MKHIIFYSGGLGNWATAKRVAQRHGKDNMILLFTDTLIEDQDLYRFLLETTQNIYNIDQSDLIERTKHIPETSHETMEDRKEHLKQLADETRERNPNFVWLNDGRDPWDVFKDVRFLGNSRLANCSHELKQKMSKKWIKDHYSHEECVLYLGIDWTEEHRTKAPRKNWAPYQVEYPMCEEPLITKIDLAKDLEAEGLERPRLYEWASHNNCGGFCVRAGQGHFAELYRNKPKLYKYHEEKEKEMQRFLEREVTILKRTRDGEKLNLSLEQLRHELEQGGEQVDMFDVGGCGCFVDDN